SRSTEHRRASRPRTWMPCARGRRVSGRRRNACYIDDMVPEMHDNRDAMRALNSPLEGRVDCMYLDVKGLVTVGVGNLVDPVHLAERLPFRRPDGSLATREEIRAAWHTVKTQGNPRRLWTTYARE